MTSELDVLEVEEEVVPSVSTGRGGGVEGVRRLQVSTHTRGGGARSHAQGTRRVLPNNVNRDAAGKQIHCCNQEVGWHSKSVQKKQSVMQGEKLTKLKVWRNLAKMHEKNHEKKKKLTSFKRNTSLSRGTPETLGQDKGHPTGPAKGPTETSETMGTSVA